MFTREKGHGVMSILLYQINGKRVAFARLENKHLSRFLHPSLRDDPVFDKPPTEAIVEKFAKQYWVSKIVNVKSELGAALTQRDLRSVEE
jgi:hypothetical protein